MLFPLSTSSSRCPPLLFLAETPAAVHTNLFLQKVEQCCIPCDWRPNAPKVGLPKGHRTPRYAEESGVQGSLSYAGVIPRYKQKDSIWKVLMAPRNETKTPHPLLWEITRGEDG